MPEPIADGINYKLDSYITADMISAAILDARDIATSLTETHSEEMHYSEETED